MNADFSLYAEIRRHPVEIADWFAIAAGVQPLQGYGFATDARVGEVWNPPHDYPDPDTAHRAFSWELGAAASARCVHLFRTGMSAAELADSVGRCWYEYIYEPLRATLEVE